MEGSGSAALSAEQSQIAQHYSGLQDRGISYRQNSPLIQMRAFHNWIKSLLINRAISRCGANASVLDLCGGKGGDFLKWKNARIGHLILCDVAHQSVNDALARYSTCDNNRGRPLRDYFPAIFIVADCFRSGLFVNLPSDYKDLRFDLVSCQFALHYAFESEERVRGMLRNVTERLKSGACWIATTLNANLLVKKVRDVKARTGQTSWGNGSFKIRFESAQGEGQEQEQEEHDTLQFPAFGARYFFHLDEAVLDVPEYLVHLPTFAKLAEEYGLTLVYEKPFHEFYAEHITSPENRELFTRMGCLSQDRPTYNPESWEISELYIALIFQKAGTYEPPHPRQRYPAPYPQIIDSLSHHH